MQHRFLVVLILLAMMFNTSWRGQSSFCILEDAEIACEFDAEAIDESLEIKIGQLWSCVFAIGLVVHTIGVLFLSKENQLVFALIRFRRGPPMIRLA
jgi:hypothetical protein